MSSTLDFEITATSGPPRPPNASACWPTPGSGSTSPTTWSRSADRRTGAGTTRGSNRTGPSRWTRPARCSTTRRSSSRDSRRTSSPTGRSSTFRPYMNAARMNRSAHRMAMPEMPEQLFVDAVELLVRTDKDWVPDPRGTASTCGPSCSRPPRALGVNSPADEFMFVVIASPAGRTSPAGSSRSRCGCRRTTPARPPAAPARRSSAATTRPPSPRSAEAVENGCDQVVWLDAVERRWVEEVGAMNLMFVYGSGPSPHPHPRPHRHAPRRASPATPCSSSPPTSASRAEEGRISVDEWEQGCASGEITEVFACGTAAVITRSARVKGATASGRSATASPAR